MTHAIYRYRMPKPPSGHFKLDLPEGATVLNYVEHWHTEEGWTIAIDVLESPSKPRERRWFFLCNAGDNLGFIGEYPDVHYIGSHESKSYSSYLFDTSHLSETEREQGHVEPRRFNRGRPDRTDLSTTVRRIYDDRRPQRQGRTGVAQAFDKAKEAGGGQGSEQGAQPDASSAAAGEATSAGTGDDESAPAAATG